MLNTPFGTIKICVDGVCTDYEAVAINFTRPPCDKKPIAACYRIEIPAKNCDSIACKLEPVDIDIINTGDSGESYLNAQFIKDKCILTIGMEDDNPAFESLCLPFGLQYNLICPINKVVFGIAWATDYECDGDVRTWFAADPTISS